MIRDTDYKIGDINREIVRLIKPNVFYVFISIVFGLSSGVSVTLLLAKINAIISGELSISTFSALFLACIVLFLAVGQAISSMINSKISQDIVASLRLEVLERLLTAPIDVIERMGGTNISHALQRDVFALSQVALMTQEAIVASAMVTACAIYLAYLSPLMFLFALCAIIGGTYFELTAKKRGAREIAELISAEEDLHRKIWTVSSGAKEIRLSRSRRNAIRSDISKLSIQNIRKLAIKSRQAFIFSSATRSVISYGAIACIAFAFTAMPDRRGIAFQFIFVLIYTIGYVERLVQYVPNILQSQVAFRRLATMAAKLATPERGISSEKEDVLSPIASCIELRSAQYAYDMVENNSPFVVGPLNILVRSGEIVFITGDNGSGKTTLIKMLLGLYPLSKGGIFIDGRPVPVEMLDNYRQMFSCVFFDYFLFENILGIDRISDENVSKYIDKLELNGKVDIRNGSFSTIDLSAGQRKRLALIQIYFENRPFIVFDEWAAEQDPTFRQFFYTQLLPDLKSDGKGIVVISHDDRFYHLADRVISMKGGMIQ